MSIPTEPDFRNLFESAPGLYLVLRPDAPRFTIAAVSDAYAKQTMTKREEILGRGLFDVFPDNPNDPNADGVSKLTASLMRVIESRMPDEMAIQKYDIRRPESEGGQFEERHWKPKNSPVFGQDGQLKYIIHQVEEVTEFALQKQESESRFRGALDSAYHVVVSVNEEGIIEFANKQVQHTFGYEPNELLGKSLNVLIPARHRETHVRHTSDYMVRPRTRPMGRNLNLSAVRKDGLEFPVDISLAPWTSQGKTTVTAFIRDVSEEKKQQERQLFLSESGRILSESVEYQDRMQRVVDLIAPRMVDSCAIHVLNNENLALASLSPQSNIRMDVCLAVAETVVKNSLPQLIVDVSGCYFAVPLEARGHKFAVISYVLMPPASFTKDDLSFLELISSRFALSLDNARLYTQAQKSILLRDEVLSIVSHDLRNPLSSISMASNLLGRGGLGAQDASVIIERSAQQMDRLIGDLLDLARIQAGSFSVETRPLPIGKSLDDGLQMVYPTAKGKEIELVVEIEPQIPSIKYDLERITQVIYNLVGNAIKFSPSKSTVRINAKKEGCEVVIAVRDEGPGIPQENLARIFDKYWQEKGTAKLGAGLGLYIAKQIVEAHGGRIWAESKEGIGSTFYFALPVSNDEANPPENHQHLNTQIVRC